MRTTLAALLVAAFACSSPSSPSAPAPRVSSAPAPGGPPGGNADPAAAPPAAAEPPAESEPAEPAATSKGPMQTLLAEHNRYRAAHCAPPLTWSDELAAFAQRWADHLRDAGCAFEHNRSKYGENLAAGTTGALGPEEVVAMWYREVDKYDWKAARFSMEAGHFTQLVWKDSQRLGCGVSQCRGMSIWVCNYDPPGNVQGLFTRNVLPTSCR